MTADESPDHRARVRACRVTNETDVPIPLGVLDLSRRGGACAHDALNASLRVARSADAAGYSRYWVSEHHVNDSVHACPEIVIAVAAQSTSSIRVGAGGVLLRYYSPWKIAETFLTLGALFPDRIDLGVARGPGVTNDDVALALVSHNYDELENSSYVVKILELCSLLDSGGSIMSFDQFDQRPQPSDAKCPTVWLLGASAASAELAAKVGIPFAFPSFASRRGIEAAMRLLPVRNAQLGEGLPSIVTVSVTVADTTRLALQRDAEQVSRGELAANVVGDPWTVARQLRQIRESTGCAEVMLTSFSADVDEWAEHIGAIATVWRSNDTTTEGAEV